MSAKHSDFIKKDAERLYLLGKRLTDIARDLHISLSTVDKWRMRYKWDEKREEQNRKLDESWYKHLEKRMKQSVSRYLDGSVLVADKMVKAMSEVGDVAEENIDYFGKLTRNLCSGAVVHRQVVPNPDAEKADLIIAELRKLQALVGGYETKENSD